jgi:LuxR family transcriptional regulator, maltose regulon positive regulatory protein
MPGSMISRGREALAKGAWEEARDLFQAVLAQSRSPEALEAFATACWFLNDWEIVFETREEAYSLYRAQGELASAARIALALYWDYRAVRGEAAVSNGWLQRAERLLEGLDSTREYGWLHYQKAQSALFSDHNPAAAREHTAICGAIGHAQHCIDFEIAAMALDGLAFVIEGDPESGRRCLDEAMTAIVGGEVTDLTVVGFSSCHMITACELMRDYDRALQWCERLKAFCARWRIRPLMVVCRTHYAGICIARGAWGDAEAELASAAGELEDTHTTGMPEVPARLGELRRRQGRIDEAESLFADAEPHPLAVLGRARLALDRDQPLAARELVERYLRRVPERERSARTEALDILVRAAAMLSDRPTAASASAELQQTAAILGSDPIRAMAAACAGIVALADADWETARSGFEDAADLFSQAGMSFDAARAQLDRARAVEAAGRCSDALQMARAASQIFEAIGASGEAERARIVCCRLDSAVQTSGTAGTAAPASAFDRLTPRELEVLKLVTRGLSNPDIARQLHRSEHTIHRHVSNILNKLDLPTRAAAAAAAAREGLT